MIRFTSIIFVFAMFELFAHVNCAATNIGDGDVGNGHEKKTLKLRGQDLVDVKGALMTLFETVEKEIYEPSFNMHTIFYPPTNENSEGDKKIEGDKITVTFEEYIKIVFPPSQEEIDYEDIYQFAGQAWIFCAADLSNQYFMVLSVRQQFRTAIKNYRDKLPEVLKNEEFPLKAELEKYEKMMEDIDTKFGADKFANANDVSLALAELEENENNSVTENSATME